MIPAEECPSRPVRIEIFGDSLTEEYPGEFRPSRVSSTRDPRFTLDGVHLNSLGARMVADAFAEAVSD